jgi:uncharacterized protein DUF3221
VRAARNAREGRAVVALSRTILLLSLACVSQGPRSRSSSGEVTDVVTTEPPSIRGTITRKASQRILIEEQPLDSSGSGKASVRLTPATRVLRSSGEAGRVAELRVGQRVSAWFDGPVQESYPLQATAGVVRIDGEEGVENQMEIDGVIRYYELEGGFYAIRGEDGETYNPINLPEEFRQDGLPVRVSVRPRDDMVGIHQTGPLVEIVEIRKR